MSTNRKTTPRTGAKLKSSSSAKATRKNVKPAAKRATSASGLGTYVTRKDGPEKVDGSARYVDDLNFSGMLHLAVAMSEHPHAYLDDVNVEAARQAPGVHAVITAEDVPGENMIAVASADQPLLATEKVRWHGDRLALIAADTPLQARAAAELVKGTYRPLPGVFDMEEALKKGAAVLHEKHPTKNLAAKGCVYKGDVKKGEKLADVIVEGVFDIGMQEHAYLEPQGALAVPEKDGSVTLYGSMQCPFYVQEALCKVLDLPMNKVRVVQTVTGGAFGGKEDYPSEPAACAALLAQKTGRPVKFIMSREEDMSFSTKREAQRVHHRIGAKKDGTLVFVDIDLYLDSGAYLGLASIVADRGNASSIGPYRVPHVRVDTHTVYTCNAFSGAFRGFGHPQVAVATESQMDELAKKLGMCPVELRRINLLQSGDIAPTGEKLFAPVEASDTLEQALKRLDYDEVKKRIDVHNEKNERTRLGLGISTISYGSCLHAGGQFLEGAGSLVQVHRDGSVSVSVGNTEMGQGMVTVMAQLAADTLGIHYDQVRVKATDTDLVPDSGPTVASRTTTMSGQAVVDGCRQLRDELEPTARRLLGLKSNARVVFEGGKLWGEKTPRKKKTFFELIATAYVEKRQLMKSGWYAPPRKVWDVKTGQGQPYSAYAYATQIAVVEVDTLTGRTRVQKVVACHDVGKAIFPDGAAGQVEGGIVQGLGYALMERFSQKDGKIRNNNFTDYIIPSALDAPEIDVVLIESEGVGKGQSAGPMGAKGLGEPSLIPIAGAICNAISYATGERVLTMPFMPERVLEALEKAGTASDPLLAFPTA